MRVPKNIRPKTLRLLVLLAVVSSITVGFVASAIVQEINVEVLYPLAFSCSISVDGQAANIYTGVNYGKYTFYNVHKLTATCTPTDTSYTYSICIHLRNYMNQVMESPCTPNTVGPVTATWPP